MFDQVYQKNNLILYKLRNHTLTQKKLLQKDLLKLPKYYTAVTTHVICEFFTQSVVVVRLASFKSIGTYF